MRLSDARVSWGRCLAGVVLVVGASACASAPAHPARGPADEVLLNVSAASDIKLPLDARYPSAEQDLLIQRAEGALTRRCMRRGGHTYEPPKPFHFDMVSARARLFGLVDEKEAREHGYAGRFAADPKPSTKLRSPAAEKALAGCFDETAKVMAKGAGPLDPSMLDQLVMHTLGQAEADRRVKAKVREWSACMKTKGFIFADSWQANDDPRWQPGKATALERRTAVADVQCKHSTGLVDTWYSVLVDYQHQALNTHAAELKRLAEAIATRAATAERALTET